MGQFPWAGGMDISDAEIAALVGKAAFQKGKSYAEAGRVQHISREGETISAKVRGSGRRVYVTRVRVHRTANGRLSAFGSCACPIGTNCKHVATVLLAARSSSLTAPSVPRRPEPKPVAAQAPGSAAVPSLDFAPPTTLPQHILAWVDSLKVDDSGDDYPPEITQRLVYVLSPNPPDGATPLLSLTIRSVRLLKSGLFSDKGSQVDPYMVLKQDRPRFLRRSDIAILRAIVLSGGSTGQRIGLDGRDGLDILAGIQQTGRARWLEPNGPPLVQGPARQGHFAWDTDERGDVVPRLTLDEADPEALILAATPPVYVVPDTGTIGRIETGLSAQAARAMLSAPRLRPDQVTALAQLMRQGDSPLAQFAPPVPTETVVLKQPPIPVFQLTATKAFGYPFGDADSYSYYLSDSTIGTARLSFRYGPALIERHNRDAALSWLEGRRLFHIRRDMAAEKRFLRTLKVCGLVEGGSAFSGPNLVGAFHFPDEPDWFEFVAEEVPRLRAEGWEIHIADDFPFRVLDGDSEITVRISESSGLDWFELELGITIDGEQVDLVPLLIEFIRTTDPTTTADLMQSAGEVLYLQLDPDRYLSLPVSRLLPFIETLQQLFAGAEMSTGKLRSSALDAAQLDRLNGLEGVVWQGGDRVRALGRKLANTGHIPDVPVPDGFTATLRPYQARGLAWLDLLRDAGLGGILADDMGLGKTLQALALIASEKASGRLTSPALIIAPTSLMSNWQREATRFAPGLKVLVLQGLDRKRRFDDIETADIVLSTYPLVARDKDVLMARDWHILLLDEAQAIKNPNAATTRQIGALRARHRFCLTGTPIENNLTELWSLFNFIAPGFLGDAKTFSRDWRTPIEKNGDGARARLLAARVRPFLLRRTKEAVALDLPPKTEMVEAIAFEPAQQALYDTIRLAMHERVRQAMAEKGLSQSRIVILDALLKLRQTCCDPRLLKGVQGSEKAGSAKLERLMDMLRELVAEGRKVIVFSQFTSMLDLMRPELEKAGINYALLTGETLDRAGVVAAFQEGPAPVFLVSLKAGGVGLNLTAADTVILYDPWWNPAVEAQAIDRAHRIGQTKPVFVFKLTSTGTIEEKIEVLKARKAALADSLFDPDSPGALDITEADIEMLFGQ